VLGLILIPVSLVKAVFDRHLDRAIAGTTFGLSIRRYHSTRLGEPPSRAWFLLLGFINSHKGETIMKNRVSVKVRATVKWLKIHLDHEALRKDLRNLGLVLMGLGIAGFIISKDTTSFPEGVVLLIWGLIAWLLGLFKRNRG
jgi:hypothetical protein